MKRPRARIISRTTLALLLLSAVTAATFEKTLGASALRLRSLRQGSGSLTGSWTEAEPGQPAVFQATSTPVQTPGQAEEKKPAPPPTQTQPKTHPSEMSQIARQNRLTYIEECILPPL